jgi:tRNA threonylcarbamoyl adenosine modification protein YeaZ
MKYGLAIHATTGELGLSINNFQGDNRSQVWELGRDLSNYLHEYLLKFLKPQTWSDLEFIGVAKGPGSFTSTRIGVVTGRTLGQQLNIPVYGISSLASLAYSVSKKYDRSQNLAIEMKASRGQLFVGIYQTSSNHNGLITHLKDTIASPQKWNEILKNWPSNYQLIKSPQNLGDNAPSLLDLACFEYYQNSSGNWQDLTPFYGQNPS